MHRFENRLTEACWERLPQPGGVSSPALAENPFRSPAVDRKTMTNPFGSTVTLAPSTQGSQMMCWGDSLLLTSGQALAGNEFRRKGLVDLPYIQMDMLSS